MSYVGFRTLILKEFHRFLRLYAQTILPPIITSLLYILIFGYSIGSRIPDIHGFSYMQFIIPGLLMMGVITSSYANTSASLFVSRFHGNVQELLLSPLSNIQIVFALVLGGVARGFFVGFGIFLIATLFAGLPITHISFIIFFVFVVSFIFSCLGFLTAMWADNFDKLTIFPTFLITPLIYLGGVFYSINMLPQLWQNVSLFNPLLYFINGIRYGFLGISDVNITIAIISSIVISIALFYLCYYLFKIGYNIKT